MRNLLYKELKLTIQPFFFLMPFLMGALFLIPNWLFFIALAYFFFISIPNIFSSINTQNDNGFSVMMPVEKKDIVRARIASMVILELLHLVGGGIFAMLNLILYKQDNFAFDLNLAFFGCAFMMFGLFNVVFFPLYYRTAYRYGVPTIVATASAIGFATVVELTVILIPEVNRIAEGTDPAMRLIQALVLVLGVLLFFAATLVSCRLSAKRFAGIDL